MNADPARRRSLASTSIVAAMLAGALAAAPAAVAGTGGTLSSLPPQVDAVECLRDCAGIDVARPGSLVRITGDELASASKVNFSGAAGAADDVSAVVTAARQETLTVTVPAGARTGPVVVVNGDGLASESKVDAVDRSRPAEQLRRRHRGDRGTDRDEDGPLRWAAQGAPHLPAARPGDRPR